MTSGAEHAADRARRRAAGYRLAPPPPSDVVPAPTRPPRPPRVNRSPGDEPAHGSRARYCWSLNPCRCTDCTEANRIYMAARRHGDTPPRTNTIVAARPQPRTVADCPHPDEARCHYPAPIGEICARCGTHLESAA